MPPTMTAIRQPSALGYRPSLPDGTTDWTRYHLQVVTFTGAGRDDHSCATLTFPDKLQAMAHAKAIGATFQV